MPTRLPPAARPAPPNAGHASRASSASPSAAARAGAPAPGTSQPFDPGRTASVAAPTGVVTIGRPAAIASTIERPKPSYSLGNTNRSAACSQGTGSRTLPGSSSEPASGGSAARRRSSGSQSSNERSPVPSSARSGRGSRSATVRNASARVSSPLVRASRPVNSSTGRSRGSPSRSRKAGTAPGSAGRKRSVSTPFGIRWMRPGSTPTARKCASISGEMATQASALRASRCCVPAAASRARPSAAGRMRATLSREIASRNSIGDSDRTRSRGPPPARAASAGTSSVLTPTASSTSNRPRRPISHAPSPPRKRSSSGPARQPTPFSGPTGPKRTTGTPSTTSRGGTPGVICRVATVTSTPRPISPAASWCMLMNIPPCISGRKPSVRTQTRIGLGAEAAMRLLAGWGRGRAALAGSRDGRPCRRPTRPPGARDGSAGRRLDSGAPRSGTAMARAKRELPAPTLYESDYYSWTLEQAALLREHRIAELNLENVAEEVEDLARRQADELGSRYETLLMHLLKWEFQPERRSHRWEATLGRERDKITDHLVENPGLKPRRQELFAKAYKGGRSGAAADPTPPPPLSPATNPYALDEAMDPEFWPGGRELPARDTISG